MTQTRTNTETRILDAAVQLFSRQGYSGTSTREIARLADVNEASLFRYFARKQDLFWAALQSRLERLRIRKELQSELTAVGKPELVVPLIAELLVHITMYQPDLIRLFCVGLLELRPIAEQALREHVVPLFEAVRNYFQSCIERGTIRDLDPSIVTVAFGTTVLSHLSLYPLLNNACAPYVNTEEAVSVYSRLWLNALLPVHNQQAGSLAS